MSRFVVEPPEEPRRVRPHKDRQVDPFYIWMLILIVLVALLTVGTTAYFLSSAQYEPANGQSGLSSEAVLPNSSEIESSGPGADASSEAMSSNAVTSAPNSSAETSSAETSSEDVSSQPAESAAVDMAKAEALFGKNSIDAETENGLNEAASTAALLAVYDQGLSRWQTAITDMVNRIERLSKENAAVQQQKWADRAATQIEAQRKELTEDSGTIKQVELAEFTYELYRTRARELFCQLYRYDPDFRL